MFQGCCCSSVLGASVVTWEGSPLEPEWSRGGFFSCFLRVFLLALNVRFRSLSVVRIPKVKPRAKEETRVIASVLMASLTLRLLLVEQVWGQP